MGLEDFKQGADAFPPCLQHDPLPHIYSGEQLIPYTNKTAAVYLQLINLTSKGPLETLIP